MGIDLRREGRRRSIGRVPLVGAVLAALLGGLLLAVVPTPAAPSAQAVDNSGFDPGFIISDDVFFDDSTMSASAIKAFFKAKDPSCRSTSSLTCLSDYVETSRSRAANSNCSAITGKKESAASILYRVAKACDINPQVLLVLLQKEQGFITGGPRSSLIYRKAMGYGCPDTASCDAKYYGFFNQVYSSAWQYQRYAEAPQNFNHQAGRNNAVRFHPNASCGSSTVYIRNQATAGLYNYTPYQPNAAALAAGSGTGNSCSSYGNRNFWRFFTSWFGNPANLLKNAGFEASSSGWGSGVKTVGLARKKSSASAESGAWYLSTSTAKKGSSLRQTVKRTSRAGEVYTASVWVKSRSSSTPFRTVLKLTATGGRSESARAEATVGPEWTQLQVSLPVTRTHTAFVFDLYEMTTGVSLAVDSALLAEGEGEPSRAAIGLKSAGFEGSQSGWSTTSSAVTTGVRTKLAEWPASQGSSFLLAKTTKAGGTVQQDVAYPVEAGRSYTASIMLRTSGSAPFAGALVLRGTGGAGVDSARTDFEVDGEWSRQQVTFTATRSDLRGLRFEVRLNTTGAYLHMDDVRLSSNLAADTGFERSALGGWTTGSGDLALRYRVGGATHPDIPDDEVSLLAKRRSDSVASLRAPVDRKLSVGETYDASILVRSTGGDVNGSLRIWGLGASSEHGSQGFTADGDWQLVETSYTPTVAGQTSLRVELYLNTVGGELEVDGLWLR